jgi:hypothetical protein
MPLTFLAEVSQHIRAGGDKYVGPYARRAGRAILRVMQHWPSRLVCLKPGRRMGLRTYALKTGGKTIGKDKRTYGQKPAKLWSGAYVRTAKRAHANESSTHLGAAGFASGIVRPSI